jgi:hypothetical protein
MSSCGGGSRIDDSRPEKEDGQGGGGGGESGGFAAAITIAIAEPTPIGEAAVAVVAVAAAAVSVYQETNRTYVTYTLWNAQGQVYVGRTSGFGTPHQVMMQRYYSHEMRLFGFGNPSWIDRPWAL